MRVELEGTVKTTGADAALPGPGGRRCVLVSSWESSRSFPRTRAGVIAFELATDDGHSYLVEPTGAAARVAVRQREPGPDGNRETGFIELGERITVRGELDETVSPAVVAANLIAQPDQRPCGVGPHRIPPGGLTVAAPEPAPAPVAGIGSGAQQILVAEPPQGSETPPPEIIPPLEAATEIRQPPPTVTGPARTVPENRQKRRRR